jgi:hypothetical protein
MISLLGVLRLRQHNMRAVYAIEIGADGICVEKN